MACLRRACAAADEVTAEGVDLIRTQFIFFKHTGQLPPLFFEAKVMFAVFF